ncbi:MAG: actin-binding WH2 domain-containing protein [Prochloron sp. SP5CPC1]|nr:actin-binding WH2 domain-containing protein [Candidatus Paraprochloron terpiosi SP5CPC1]
MAILTMLLASIYGFVMGLGNGPLQAFFSCLKLPLLFLLTAIICIPSLYTFNVLLGQRFRFVQTVALMVTTLGTTSVLLASLAPVAFFFTMTTNNYSFLLLMHVGIMALCGVYGVQYLYRGCSYLAYRRSQKLNNLLLKIWILLYGIVGMQLGWRLRPFVGNPDSPVQLFRTQEEGNFYLAVWAAFSNLFGSS